MTSLVVEHVWWFCTQLQCLAKRVLSQVVNTNVGRGVGVSTISYSVKRNRLNVNRAESLVYVHYNLRLSHYCEEAKMDKTYKIWEIYPEVENLEDGALALDSGELGDCSFDDDHRVEMLPSPIAM